jgi:hypothetical protein
MLRSSARIGLEIVASLLAGIVLLVGFTLWRLSWEEPLRVGFLTPYLEQTLQAQNFPYKIDIGDTLLTWEGWGNSIDVTATDVSAVDAEGNDIAQVPRVSFGISVRALLRGMIAPVRVAVYHPVFVVHRLADGQIRIGHRAMDEETPLEESILFPTLVEELLDEPSPGQFTGYLTSAAIVDAEIVYIDDATGLTWRPENTTVRLERNKDGLTGHISLKVPELGRPALISAAIRYDAGTQRVVIDGRLDEFELASLGLLNDELMRFANADLLLNGTIGFEVGLDGTIGETLFDLSSGPGRIELPRFYDEPLPITALSLLGRVAPGMTGVTIEKLSVAIAGGPSLGLVGSLDGLKGGPASLALDIAIQNVAFTTLPRFWPSSVGADARDWITRNIPEGQAPSGNAVVRMHWPDGLEGEPVVDEMHASADATGLTVHYLDPLPPLTNANGHATFEGGNLTVDITSANVGEIQVVGGKLVISNIGGEGVQILVIDGEIKAPLAAALELLDHPRLGYVTSMGIDREGALGETLTDMHFEFPAKKGLELEEVDITAQAQITGASLARVPLDQQVVDGNFDLDFDMTGLTLTGTATVGGVPIDLHWAEYFGETELERRIDVVGTATTKQVAAVVVDVEPFIVGPVKMDIGYLDYEDGRSEVVADLDLTDATVEMSEVAYKKTPGEVGHAKFTLEMLNNVPQRMQSVDISGPNLSATNATVGFEPESGKLASITLPTIALGDSVVTDAYVAFAGTRTDIVLGGGVLDAAPFMGEDVAEEPAAEPGDPEPVPEPAPEPTEPGLEPEAEPTPLAPEDVTPSFTLQAENLERVMLGSGRTLENARIKLHNENDSWQWIEVDGLLGDGVTTSDNTIMIRYVPTVEGRHELAVEASDAGATLAAFNVTTAVVGGRLTITGSSDDSNPDSPLEGKLNITQFRLVDAPRLGRLLSVATLTGLVDVLTGEGFLFTGLRLDFSKKDGHIDIDDGRAHGPSLGITADGWIDIEKQLISLEGTLVPAYALNSILGNIPILGTLLQGGKGEGLFAATYSATGSLDNPDFSYNPLAALAPGFLRGLFEMAEPGNAPPEGTPVDPYEPPAPVER